MDKLDITSLIKEGEGQKVEFKEKLAALASVMVAFANAGGGRIYLGLTDSGEVKLVSLTNKLKSQIADIARNCDPALRVRVCEGTGGIVIVDVPEGEDKPYKCKEGFFLRVGPNSQKLTRDEVVHLIKHVGKIRFDEIVNENFSFPNDFDRSAWDEFKRLAGYPAAVSAEDALINIGVASMQESKLLVTNAAVLFFARNPQKFHPEAKITCLKYRGDSRFEIMDRREYKGALIKQLVDALAFVDRYNAKQIKITGKPRHEVWEDYPSVAIREALINALIHRDYFYDSSHIYVHIYDGRLEIDNPGGLIADLLVEDLGSKAARRNRMLADLMQRAGYIENAGTGILRIREALKRNNNLAPEITAANFFSLRLIARPKNLTEDSLTDRQRKLYAFVAERELVSKTDCQRKLNVSSDTTLSELKMLIAKGLVQKTGKGKNTRYSLV